MQQISICFCFLFIRFCEKFHHQNLIWEEEKIRMPFDVFPKKKQQIFLSPGSLSYYIYKIYSLSHKQIIHITHSHTKCACELLIIFYFLSTFISCHFHQFWSSLRSTIIIFHTTDKRLWGKKETIFTQKNTKKKKNIPTSHTYTHTSIHEKKKTEISKIATKKIQKKCRRKSDRRERPLHTYDTHLYMYIRIVYRK